jgi:AraC-like DNA-binding protein
VITGPDVVHELDATGTDVLLVFVDPESEVGTALSARVGDGVRALSADEVAAIDPAQDPLSIMTEGGAAWTARVALAIGGAALPVRAVHPAVRRLLRKLREAPPDAETSLEALARAVRLSPGRLMHAFTASIGVPLRPYLAWLKLQRAAAAIASGVPLSEAAHAAGFADAGHMSRSFRRMFGTPPSALRPR